MNPAAKYLLLLFLLPALAWADPKVCGPLFDKLYGGLQWEMMPEAGELVERLTRELASPEARTLAPYERNYVTWLLEQAKTNRSREILEQMRTAKEALEVKRDLRAVLARSLNAAKVVAKIGIGQWRYLLAVEAVQFVSEGISRQAEMEGVSPIVFMKKLITNPELIQNMAFMANETFWMSGLSAASDGHSRSWAEIARSFKRCAILAFVDSNAMNLAIKGEPDLGRVALDTGWEMGFGSAQTQLDLVILNKFEKLAVRFASSKLKLVGYAVVMVEQGIGFIGYSEATQAYEGWKKGGAPAEPAKEPVKGEDLILVPIFAGED